MTGSIGMRRGRCSRATYSTAGMPTGMPAESRTGSSVQDLRFVARLFGASHIRQLAAVTIAGGMNLAGMPFGKGLRHTGLAIMSKRQCASLSVQKPIECMAFPIRNHAGDVYDPFVGSGTTLVAAEQNARACYAMEIEPPYCAVAIARWESYTGQRAELIPNGKGQAGSKRSRH